MGTEVILVICCIFLAIFSVSVFGDKSDNSVTQFVLDSSASMFGHAVDVFVEKVQVSIAKSLSLNWGFCCSSIIFILVSILIMLWSPLYV